MFMLVNKSKSFSINKYLFAASLSKSRIVYLSCYLFARIILGMVPSGFSISSKSINLIHFLGIIIKRHMTSRSCFHVPVINGNPYNFYLSNIK